MESSTKDVEMIMEKETDKRVYWVKYLDYQAVGINTHFFHESTAKWVERWLNVGDLIAAYRVDSVIAETSPELLSLHLPVGAERSALPEDCFANEADSALDNGCLLSDLGTIGTKSKKPLIIKSRNYADEDRIRDRNIVFSKGDGMDVDIPNNVLIVSEAGKLWKVVQQQIFNSVPDLEERVEEIKTDRLLNRKMPFRSKPLRIFKSARSEQDIVSLLYQDFHMETSIHDSMQKFLTSADFHGMLIGPTGCGKSYEMVNVAKKQFTVYIDCQSINNFEDISVSKLKNRFNTITSQWKKPNENLPKLRKVAYAFVLSRILFLKYLIAKYPNLTPIQFLLHQKVHSGAINACFNYLVEIPTEILEYVALNSDYTCLFCVDEAQVLLEHLSDRIISETESNRFQDNGTVSPKAKRGALSVLLYAMKISGLAKKVIFAGTSTKLRNIDNFGTFETKRAFPKILNDFCAWNKDMAIKFVEAFTTVDVESLKMVLTDNYRPRILENFVDDLMSLGINDNDSPKTQKARSKITFTTYDSIIKESYEAVINRFNRKTVEDIARDIRKHGQTELLFKLLLSSTLSSSTAPIPCKLTKEQVSFLEDTVGAIYLVEDMDGCTLYEGYVIRRLFEEFKEEIKNHQVSAHLELLKSIINLEGKKTTAKGTPFEAVVAADLSNLGKISLYELLSKFIDGVPNELNQVYLPTICKNYSDEEIISTRPMHVLMRPSSLFRPDIIGFPRADICLSFGIKLFTSPIQADRHYDNCESSDPTKFFIKNGRKTEAKKHLNWQAALKQEQLNYAIRFLIELPKTVNTVSTESTIYDNENTKNIVVYITKDNMRKLLSEKVVSLIDFITSE
ncbi:hypothetical protein HDV01_002673 [Terramyces sp. JEL0728]|nr:hypothetical protein HDV01_002673 [Terramyces sp. JEL0728]